MTPKWPPDARPLLSLPPPPPPLSPSSSPLRCLIGPSTSKGKTFLAERKSGTGLDVV